MAFTTTDIVEYTIDDQKYRSENATSSDGKDTREVTVEADTNDVHVLLSIDISALKKLIIHSDKAVTIKTNDSGSPDDTLSLAANSVEVWRDGGITSNPLTVDVTDLYISNAGDEDATVRIIVAQDTTP